MPVAKINDLNIRYEVQGLGEPLLLIMGYRGSGYMWGDELLVPLSRYFQVITFDNRGTGDSDKPNSVYTLPMMAEDAAGLLRHLGFSRAHVFGVSMGGMIAQELALHYPRQVDRLILGCTNCGGPHAILAPMHVLKTLLVPPDMPREEAIRRQWPVMFSPDFVKHNPDVLDRLTARSMEHPTPLYSAIRQVMAVQRFNTYGRLGQIVAPTLVVAGSADLIVPHENSFLLANRIHGATLEILPGAGHAFFWEQPGEVVELLSEFCYGSGWRDDFTEPFTDLPSGPSCSP